MNIIRRKAINIIHAKLDELKEELDSLQSEEQEAFDNMPESLQGTDKGERAEASAEALGDAVNALDEALTYLEAAAE